jgi:hypothetical protein
MTAQDSPESVSLPYPHRRNDCVMCREQDADFHVLGAEGWTDLPNGYQARVCQGCMGKWLVTFALYSRPRDVSPGEPLAVQLELLPPGRDTW